MMLSLSKRSLLNSTLLTMALPTAAHNHVKLILDGYAYEVNSNIIYNISNKTICIENSQAANCLRPGNLLTLEQCREYNINNQAIGTVNNRFNVDSGILLCERNHKPSLRLKHFH